jgi:hypothetical protein
MLDWAHGVALNAAANGDTDDSPARRNLVRAGLLAGDGTLTDAGRAALAASEPSRTERWSLGVFAGAASILAVGVVVGWLAG